MPFSDSDFEDLVPADSHTGASFASSVTTSRVACPARLSHAVLAPTASARGPSLGRVAEDLVAFW